MISSQNSAVSECTSNCSSCCNQCQCQCQPQIQTAVPESTITCPAHLPYRRFSVGTNCDTASQIGFRDPTYPHTSHTVYDYEPVVSTNPYVKERRAIPRRTTYADPAYNRSFKETVDIRNPFRNYFGRFHAGPVVDYCHQPVESVVYY